jgi:hypothetical protein
VEVGETMLGDRDVKKPGGGMEVGLVLLAAQAGLSPSCRVSSQAEPHESRRKQMPGGEPPWM